MILNIKFNMNREIYSNIRKIRELKNLTREYVAAELNMSPSGYGKMERGEVDITISRLFDISDILNVPLSSILYLDISKLFSE
jgi:transcriptional regulator with XRE-family HTH domain